MQVGAGPATRDAFQRPLKSALSMLEGDAYLRFGAMLNDDQSRASVQPHAQSKLGAPRSQGSIDRNTSPKSKYVAMPWRALPRMYCTAHAELEWGTWGWGGAPRLCQCVLHYSCPLALPESSPCGTSAHVGMVTDHLVTLVKTLGGAIELVPCASNSTQVGVVEPAQAQVAPRGRGVCPGAPVQQLTPPRRIPRGQSVRSVSAAAGPRCVEMRGGAGRGPMGMDGYDCCDA
jgi:hypothetical protein